MKKHKILKVLSALFVSNEDYAAAQVHDHFKYDYKHRRKIFELEHAHHQSSWEAMIASQRNATAANNAASKRGVPLVDTWTEIARIWAQGLMELKKMREGYKTDIQKQKDLHAEDLDYLKKTRAEEDARAERVRQRRREDNARGKETKGFGSSTHSGTEPQPLEPEHAE